MLDSQSTSSLRNPPNSQLSCPIDCPVLKPSRSVFSAVAVLEHILVSTRTDPIDVSLHSSTTLPWPHSLAIALRSVATRVHADRAPTLIKSIPAFRIQPTLTLYSVEVMVVVSDVVAVDDPVVVAVDTSQLFPNTPAARSLTAAFSKPAAALHVLLLLILRYPPKLHITVPTSPASPYSSNARDNAAAIVLHCSVPAISCVNTSGSLSSGFKHSNFKLESSPHLVITPFNRFT